MNFLSASVEVTADASKLPSQLAKAERVVKKSVTTMEKSFQKMDKAVKRVFSNVARYAKLAAAAFIGIGIASVKMAADVEEAENLFEVSMGAMADSTRRWSDELAEALHLNEYEVRKFVSTFNVMLDSMGLGVEEAAEMSQTVTQLTYDMASFYNLPTEVAFRKITSGLVGMSRPLQDIGILVKDATIKQYALNNAMWDGSGEMDEITKVQARYGVILEATTKAQGDLERTLNSSQNIFRAIWTQLKRLTIAFGKELKEAIIDTALAIRDYLIKNQDEIIQQFKDIIDWGEKVIGFFVRYKKIIGGIAKIGLLGVGGLGVGWVVMKLAFGFAFLQGIGAGLIGVFKMVGKSGISAFAKIGVIVKTLGHAIKMLVSSAGALIAGLGVATIAATYFTVKNVGIVKDILSVHKDITENLKKQVSQDERLAEIQKDRLRRGKKLLNIAKETRKVRIMAGPGKEPIDFKPYVSPDKVEPLYISPKALQTIEKMNKFVRDAKKAEEDRLQAIKDRWAILDTKMPKNQKMEQIMLHLAEQKLQKQRELNEKLLEERRLRLDLHKESSKNYQTMMDALRFEYDMLGEIDDVRERGEAAALVNAELQNMLGVDRNKLMEDYLGLLDKIHEKQNSLGYTIQLWMNKAGEMGKNLGNLLTNTFDRMADSLADALMGMEMDWKAFGRMFIKQLLAMIIKLQIAFALQTAMGMSAGASMGGSPGPAAPSTGGAGTGGMEFAGLGFQQGGRVDKTGWIYGHKDEVYSGVNNEMGFGGVTVNNYVSDTVDVEVMDEGKVINIVKRASIQMAGFDGDYRGAHKLG